MKKTLQRATFSRSVRTCYRTLSVDSVHTRLSARRFSRSLVFGSYCHGSVNVSPPQCRNAASHLISRRRFVSEASAKERSGECPNENVFDVMVIGAGIVGLSTARELALRFPSLRVCVLEKESAVATHQTSHNSGVIHCGIYYKPGSFKARLCATGNEQMYSYCEAHGIETKRVGKLIVAVSEDEIPRLKALYQTGIKNKVSGLKYLDNAKDIMAIEPLCERGLAAVHCETTGIVDFSKVAKSIAAEFTDNFNGTLLFDRQVTEMKVESQTEESSDGSECVRPLVRVSVNGGSEVLRASHVISCCGSQSDRIAANSLMPNVAKNSRTGALEGSQLLEPSGKKEEAEKDTSAIAEEHSASGRMKSVIMPVRGAYLRIKNRQLAAKLRGNIYPVPDSSVPVLGVHFTPTLDGDVILGPTATLCGGREAYTLRQLSAADVWAVLRFGGFWRQLLNLSLVHFGLTEMLRYAVISAQVRQLQRYVPSLRRSDVERSFSGIRGQAVNDDGSFVNDFLLEAGAPEPGSEVPCFLHVLNAPSPACTCCFPLAKVLVDEAQTRFKLQ